MLPTLLLTASVDPMGCVFTQHADVQLRWREYANALEQWIDGGAFSRIVWCENSGWPLEKLYEIEKRAAKRGVTLELISFAGQQYDRTLGKGYGELGIIEHAMRHSRLLAGGESPIIKVTGRYVVRDLRQLLASVARNWHSGQSFVICDLRENLRVADCRVFAASSVFMVNDLLPLRSLANDSAGVFLEHVLARAVHAALGRGGHWELMPVLPEVIGIGGSFGHQHSLSWSKRLRHQVKRRLLRY
jgi:hypothetical protein